jgi:hypothetical protein
MILPILYVCKKNVRFLRFIYGQGTNLDMILLIVLFIVLVTTSTTTALSAISVLITAVASVLTLALTATVLFFHIIIAAPQAGEPVSASAVAALVVPVMTPHTSMVVALSTSLVNEIARLGDLNVDVWGGNGRSRHCCEYKGVTHD